MGEDKDDNHHDDDYPRITSFEDKKILEKKPPNDKILYHNIAENDKDKK